MVLFFLVTFANVSRAHDMTHPQKCQSSPFNKWKSILPSVIFQVFMLFVVKLAAMLACSVVCKGRPQKRYIKGYSPSKRSLITSYMAFQSDITKWELNREPSSKYILLFFIGSQAFSAPTKQTVPSCLPHSFENYISNLIRCKLWISCVYWVGFLLACALPFVGVWRRW